MDSRKRIKNHLKLALILICREIINIVEVEMKRKKCIWMRNWIRERSEKGGSALLLQQLKSEYPSEYRLAMRMSAENFEELLSLISSNIQRNDTMLRDALPAKLKLEVT